MTMVGTGKLWLLLAISALLGLPSLSALFAAFLEGA
jgi:hypothetical protein